MSQATGSPSRAAALIRIAMVLRARFLPRGPLTPSTTITVASTGRPVVTAQPGSTSHPTPFEGVNELAGGPQRHRFHRVVAIASEYAPGTRPTTGW